MKMVCRLKRLKEVVKNNNKILYRKKINKNKSTNHKGLSKKVRNLNPKAEMKKDRKVRTLNSAS